MSNIQYAVCHLQRGSGSDSGMSCHIERKDTKGKTYVPDNANAKRTHLNRELIKFPQGVANRTEAIQYRIDHVGLHRKVGKNQTKAIRIILTGTHEQMMKASNVTVNLTSGSRLIFHGSKIHSVKRILYRVCCTWTRRRPTFMPPSYPS